MTIDPMPRQDLRLPPTAKEAAEYERGYRAGLKRAENAVYTALAGNPRFDSARHTAIDAIRAEKDKP